MSSTRPMPTPSEIYELLKRSNLVTVLVEGKDDIIFYRKIEESFEEIELDMLPAGNKDNVLAVKKMIEKNPINTKVIYVVDKDLWVHKEDECIVDVITTYGYSIENDAFCDGKIEELLFAEEKKQFFLELDKFINWYALAVYRTMGGHGSGYRTHPNKILVDDNDYNKLCTLRPGEVYPSDIYNMIKRNYSIYLRGKSLIFLILRQLSRSGRPVKYSAKQIISIGASRMGPNLLRIREDILYKYNELQA